MISWHRVKECNGASNSQLAFGFLSTHEVFNASGRNVFLCFVNGFFFIFGKIQPIGLDEVDQFRLGGHHFNGLATAVITDVLL